MSSSATTTPSAASRGKLNRRTPAATPITTNNNSIDISIVPAGHQSPHVLFASPISSNSNTQQQQQQQDDQLPPVTRAMRLIREYSLGDWALIAVLLILGGIFNTIEPHHHAVNGTNIPELSYEVTSPLVPDWLLFVLAVALPIVVLITLHYSVRPGSRQWLQNALEGVAFSVALTLFLTVCVKKIVGRPRPNFYKLCLYKDGTCHASMAHRYSAYESFPSGHSSISFAGLGFLSLYLMATFRVFYSPHKRNNLGLYALMLLPMVLAGYIATTRLHDYWHHFADVATGSALGLAVAFNANWLKFSPQSVDATDMTHLLGLGQDDMNASYGDTVTVSMLRRADDEYDV